VTITYVLILLGAGLCAGFASGLLGIGSSFIITPIQYEIYLAMGLPADTAIKMAFGTTMLVILPTAISGAWRHTQKGAVRWKTAIIMGSCSLLGAFGGASLATKLPGLWLKIAFGVVIIAASVRMFTARTQPTEQKPQDNVWAWAAWAIPAGLISGLVGIGGGMVLVPVMNMALKFKLHNAVATSLAAIIFTSLGGALGYIINGLNVPNLPSYSLGYAYLPSWLVLAVSTITMAQVGAIVAHRLPARQLGYIFAVVLLYVGLRMLGVFEFLG